MRKNATNIIMIVALILMVSVSGCTQYGEPAQPAPGANDTGQQEVESISARLNRKTRLNA